MCSEVTVGATQHGACDRFEQHALRAPHSIGAQEIRAARTLLPGAPRTLLKQRRQSGMNLVEIADRILVDDDEIGSEPLEAPVLLRVEELAHERNVLVAGDPHEHDREVARYR